MTDEPKLLRCFLCGIMDEGVRVERDPIDDSITQLCLDAEACLRRWLVIYDRALTEGRTQL
jgi:hypothetical protein